MGTRLVAGRAISTSWSQRKTPLQVHASNAVSTAIRFATLLYSEQVGLFPDAASGTLQRSHVRSLASRSQGSTRRAVLQRAAPAGQRPQYKFVFAWHAHNASRVASGTHQCSHVRSLASRSQGSTGRAFLPRAALDGQRSQPSLCMVCAPCKYIVASRITILPSDHEHL